MSDPLLVYQLKSLYMAVSKTMHKAFIFPAHTGWLRGFPTEEVAFTNRLTEKFSTSRNLINSDRDLGDFMISWDIYKLHRQNKGRDLFECDIALTIKFEHNIPTELKNKTAFFQIKRRGNEGKLKEQVERSRKYCTPFIFENSFVMFIGDDDYDIEICSFADFLNNKKGPHINSEKWLAEWMSCKWGIMDQGENVNALYNYLIRRSGNDEVEGAYIFPYAWVVYEVTLSPWFAEQQIPE